MDMVAMLDALASVGMKTLLLFPNIDAGASRFKAIVDGYDPREGRGWLKTAVNYSPEVFLNLLRSTACAVGNSSSFVREAGFFGTPVVLVGDRQCYREVSANVTRTGTSFSVIRGAIRDQLLHGRYPASELYGNGQVSPRIVEALESLSLYRQKYLSYVDSEFPESGFEFQTRQAG